MAQKFEISAKNMEVTDRIKKYVEKKIVRLDRMLTDIEETRVDLSYLKSARSAADRHVAEVGPSGERDISYVPNSAMPICLLHLTWHLIRCSDR